MIVFSTPIGERDLCFPTIVFFLFLWGWVVARMRKGLFHNIWGERSGPTIVSTCLVDSSHGNTSSPHLNGMEPLVFCEWWLVFLFVTSFLRHHFVIRGDRIQEVLFFKIHKTVCKKKYQINLNKGLLWLIIRASDWVRNSSGISVCNSSGISYGRTFRSKSISRIHHLTKIVWATSQC